MFKKALWKILSQKRELKFHKENTWRKTEDFLKQTRYLMNLFGYSSNNFIDEIIIDVGCGSKLRSKFFEKANIVAIEPLANDFIKDIEWCDIRDSKRFYSNSAEQFIPELKNSAKFVMCINVLDHAFNAKRILENCYFYLKDDGEFLLSVDTHKMISPLHPISLNDQLLKKLFIQIGFRIVRSYIGLGEIGQSYEKSLKGSALTYVLGKSETINVDNVVSK